MGHYTNNIVVAITWPVMVNDNSAMICNLSILMCFTVLTSTLGGKHACIGQEVTFTCEVTGAGRLTWVIIDNVTEENTILFDLFEDSSSLSGSHHDSTGRFTASLTNFSHNDPPYSFLGNLTSNLSVETSSADDHFTIGCQDGIINDIHLNLSIAG